MSLYGMLRTGVSGMNAQSNKLSTIADNIGNSGTPGYKRASTEFSSLLLPTTGGQYNSGAVNTSVRYAISQQGAPNYTTSATDMMIQGNGFFVVQDSNNQPFLTRAGSFRVDATTGNLINTSGFTLMGYDISGGPAQMNLNSTAGMVPVNLAAAKFAANPSTEGKFSANLPTAAENTTTGAISDKSSSLTAYDNLGNAVRIDLKFSYTPAVAADPGDPAAVPPVPPTAAADAFWSVAMTATNSATGAVTTTTPASIELEFDGNGNLTTPTDLSLDIPGGTTGFTLDISDMTNLNNDYTPVQPEVDGNAASLVGDVAIDDSGVVYAIDPKGQKMPLFQIPVATVASPDALQPEAGNVFQLTAQSGNMQVGIPNQGGNGYLISGATEQSNVDMATELTDMIVAQRDYTANSKVVQTGSDLLDVLMNLKR